MSSGASGRPAHPRSRGENSIEETTGALASGSSPLTRGKRSPLPRPLRRLRLIPAHAGKTRPRFRRAPTRRAHPRSRGENARQGGPITSGPWLIPAHAGKTRPILGGLFTDGAHPRSRGENLLAQRQEHMAAGSSPLTRGKRIGESVAHATARLIPAHAGKTCTMRRATPTCEAHPRSRGENRRLHGLDEERTGSSPLTRGKRLALAARPRARRLIPAHAGKTLLLPFLPPSRPAHPRSRGENASSPTT